MDAENRANVLIIDDSLKVELLTKVYDHAKRKSCFGFRMLTLGWSDGSTFLLVNSILLSIENKKNRINEAAEADKGIIGYKRRKLFMEKNTMMSIFMGFIHLTDVYFEGFIPFIFYLHLRFHAFFHMSTA